MKKIELVRINRSLLEIMAANGIKTSDITYLDTYDDFIELRKGLKFSAVITELSIKYNKSERTMSRTMARFREEVL